MKPRATLALANEQLTGRNSRLMPLSPPVENLKPPASPAAALAQAQPRTISESLTGFWSLIVTQFQGAFSDNVLKNLVIFMILGGSAGVLTDAEVAREHRTGEY